MKRTQFKGDSIVTKVDQNQRRRKQSDEQLETIFTNRHQLSRKTQLAAGYGMDDNELKLYDCQKLLDDSKRFNEDID